MNPKIDREVLGLGAEEADFWEKKTKAEFALWAEDKSACDAAGMNNFYGLQRFASCLGWFPGCFYPKEAAKETNGILIPCDCR